MSKVPLPARSPAHTPHGGAPATRRAGAGHVDGVTPGRAPSQYASPISPSHAPTSSRNSCGAAISTPVVKGKRAGQESVDRATSSTHGLESCYERGLENTPNAMGVVTFRIDVTASGTIKRIESANPSTMPGSVTNCMVGRFGALSFDAAGASTIALKVTCERAE